MKDAGLDNPDLSHLREKMPMKMHSKMKMKDKDN